MLLQLRACPRTVPIHTAYLAPALISTRVTIVLSRTEALLLPCLCLAVTLTIVDCIAILVPDVVVVRFVPGVSRCIRRDGSRDWRRCDSLKLDFMVKQALMNFG